MIIIEVQQVLMYVGFAIIIAFCVLIWLIVKSSNEYTQVDTERDADDFAGVIKDSHGPMTTWLWVSFAVLTIWIIGYFAIHWSEFVQFPVP